MSRTVVIGIGNPLRGDDAAGVAVAEQLRPRVPDGVAVVSCNEEPDAPALEVVPRAGLGHGASEAPRGLLYHRYRLDDEGTILDAKIVPPTSQNLKMIEEDLHAFVSAHAGLPDEELRLRCEQAIRNYDPCISCATHFLTLEVERT